MIVSTLAVLALSVPTLTSARPLPNHETQQVPSPYLHTVAAKLTLTTRADLSKRFNLFGPAFTEFESGVENAVKQLFDSELTHPRFFPDEGALNFLRKAAKSSTKGVTEENRWLYDNAKAALPAWEARTPLHVCRAT